MKCGDSTLLCLTLMVLLNSVELRTNFDPVFNWSQLDFVFPTGARDKAIQTESFIPKNNDILSIAIWKDRVFTTIFRWGKGVASSLNYVQLSSGQKSPLLIPYPSFDNNYVNEDPANLTTSLPFQSSIISVGHIKVDRCNRLWAVDMGCTEFFGTVRQIAPPALVIFDLTTDTLIRRYVLPSSYIKSDSLYANLEVDFENQECSNAFAYLPDMRGLVVYDFNLDRSWRLEHNFFGPDPNAGNLFYEKINYHWNFGIFGMATGPKRRDGSRRIYFNPLVSNKAYYISNTVLKNETYIGLNNYYYDVKYKGDRGKRGQTKTIAYDETTGVMFQTLFQRDSITCWKSSESYKKNHMDVVYKNDNHFFAGDITIDADRNLWILGNRLPVFFYGTWDVTSTDNIRIWKKDIDTLIDGTGCSDTFTFFK